MGHITFWSIPLMLTNFTWLYRISKVKPKVVFNSFPSLRMRKLFNTFNMQELFLFWVLIQLIIRFLYLLTAADVLPLQSPFGLFRFKFKLPTGIMVGCETLSLKICFSIVWWCGVYSHSLKEHVQNLQGVSGWLQNVGITLNWDKIICGVLLDKDLGVHSIIQGNSCQLC